MNIHDKHRKDALVKSLCKAKEQVETARIYLSANNREREDIEAAYDVLEHIDIALERLGVVVPTM